MLGPGYTLIYKEPVEFVSGHGAHLFDRDGNDYLDAYNNVPCVGHAHPHVVEAVARQMAAVNTNTRYVQEALVDYAERLLATFPEELSKLSIGVQRVGGERPGDAGGPVPHGWRGNHRHPLGLPRPHPGGGELLADPGLGITAGPERPAHRCLLTRDSSRPGPRSPSTCGSQVRGAIDDLERHGYRLAALITDCAYSSDGIFTDPVGYMQGVVEEVHAAGGVYIADEVQSGFARLGESMWGFSRHGVVPDIVTMGKPMGNGMPISGVVFRPEVCEEFGQNVRYFNTFAGSSIPVAAGAAVLDVLEKENVQQRVLENGKRSARRARGDHHASPLTSPRCAAAGLYVGVEIVKDRETLEPDRAPSRQRHQRHARTSGPHQRHGPSGEHAEDPASAGLRLRRRDPIPGDLRRDREEASVAGWPKGLTVHTSPATNVCSAALRGERPDVVPRAHRRGAGEHLP